MNNIISYIDYLKYEKKHSDNTIKSYNYELLELAKYFHDDIDKLSNEDISKYIKYCNKNNISSRSIAHKYTVFKSYYAYLVDFNIIKETPLKEVINPKIAKKLPVYLDYDEIDKLLDIECSNKYQYRDKAILELLYATGIRISELCNLELSNIDLFNANIKVFGKGSKERLVPLGDYALEALKTYINEYRSSLLKPGKSTNVIFLNNAGTKLSRISVFKLIKRECLKKGIKKDVSPHTIRHTFATHLLLNGADLKIIQELLGHSDLSTTEIYMHLVNDKIKKDYEEYHPHSHRNN